MPPKPIQKEYLLVGVGNDRSVIQPLGHSACSQEGCSIYLNYMRSSIGIRISGNCGNDSMDRDEAKCLATCKSVSYVAAQTLWASSRRAPDNQDKAS